jgi:hypothetical protein
MARIFRRPGVPFGSRLFVFIAVPCGQLSRRV